MQIQVNIDQAAALRRGIDAPHSTAKIEIIPADLPPDIREWIAAALWDGYRLDRQGFQDGIGSIPEPTVAGLVEHARARMAAAAREKTDRVERARAEAAEKRAATQRVLDGRVTERRTMQIWVSRVDGALVVAAPGNRAPGADVSGEADYVSADWPYYFDASIVESGLAQAWAAELRVGEEAAIKLATERAIARLEAREASEREKAAVLALRTAQIERWIAERGTANQRARHAAGALAEQEALDAMCDEVFAPLASEPRYERLTRDDAEHAEDCEGCEVSFRVEAVEKLTAAQWDRAEAIKRALGRDCTAETRTHSAVPDGDGCSSCTRIGIRLTVQDREIVHRREFAAE